ncbi:hypothetical protein Btru_067027 [Bulinus truncatus]|nr:hypothetical protein Btru_067027 [Bulinus truncatus]
MSITQASSKSSEIALISEEERAALGKVRLEDDVSESTIRTETKSAIVLVDKQELKFIGPPIPVHRDAMGKYIPPKNGRPLTFSDVPTPGPADYTFDFNTVAHKYPVFSLGERPPELKRNKQKRTPAPNKYNLHRDPVWGKCKRFPLGIKLPNPEFHKVRKSPGPAAYCPDRNICNGPKFSMGTKDERVIGGLVSRSTANPRPQLLPRCRIEWLQKPKSFGLTFHKDDPQSGPGPGKYMMTDTPKGPKWKIGSKPGKGKTVEMPGPANYGFKSTIGNGPKFHIGSVAPEMHSRFVTPGPNLYNREGFHLDEPGFTMKYRWFDTKPSRVPGPNKYTVQEGVVKKQCPAYTMSKKTKPTYPASVYSAAGPDGPGPGEYDPQDVMGDTGKTFGERHLEFPAEGKSFWSYAPE